MAFSEKNRILGVAAKNQMITNMKNTIYGFKRLLGRKHNDPQVQQELRHLNYQTTEQPDGGIGIRVCIIYYFIFHQTLNIIWYKICFSHLLHIY